MEAERERAVAFLQRDVLRNILPLKMLHDYPAARCRYVEQRGGAGALVLLPTAVSPFDLHTYPDTCAVVLLSATAADAADALLAEVPTDEALIFKFSGSLEREAALGRFVLQPARRFCSYTTRPGSTAAPDPAVRVMVTVEPASLELFVAQGHDRAEVLERFAAGAAQALALGPADAPAAVCFVHRNFGPVWEVGGVYTAPEQRRGGLARRVVVTALHALVTTGRIPRYQVQEDNHASIGLAEALGLERFAVVEHYRYTPARRLPCSSSQI